MRFRAQQRLKKWGSDTHMCPIWLKLSISRTRYDEFYA